MNHDYAHCADYTNDCPWVCFRGALVRDLFQMDKPMPVSWMHLKATSDCVLDKVVEEGEEDG